MVGYWAYCGWLAKGGAFTNRLLLRVMVLLPLYSPLHGATYFGNGNSGFGGPNGLGSLYLTDNGRPVSGQVNKGPNGFNDVLVIYIDTGSGGFASTSGFADGSDGPRKAISGFDGGRNRTVPTFPTAFCRATQSLSLPGFSTHAGRRRHLFYRELYSRR